MTNLMNELNPAEFNIMKDPLYLAIIVSLYAVVIVLGALGNTLVVVTVAKTKQLWNATNIFIANLALADILVCAFDLPLNAYYQITDDWVFGRTLCHVIPSAFAVVVYASTLSLTMIAVDRYILIVFPLRRRMTITMAMLLVVAIAVVSTAVASPIAIYAEYSEFIDPSLNINWRICGEKWPTRGHRRLYTISTLALQYFVPLIIIAILYYFIFEKVRERLRTVRSGSSSRKNKTTKMLVAVVTIFAISWTPFHLFALITEFSPDLVKGKYYKFGDGMLRVVAMSSSCLNPLLYGWLNDNYRNAFLSIIKRPTATPTNVRREDSEFNRNSPKTAHLHVHLSPSSSSPKINNSCCAAKAGDDRMRAMRSGPKNAVEESVPLKAVNGSSSALTNTTTFDDNHIGDDNYIKDDNHIRDENHAYDDRHPNDDDGHCLETSTSLSITPVTESCAKANGMFSSQSPLLRL
ncbi:hypothetical protein LSH36_90g01011 [Paralvinella palmiformis]|uniref:G-protein coupled receptors family 1 profile domain-containing protein n=1 Tax=Paralvinella palmiformis TaxID=53620 RepID=A0AAD9NA93_9ANNE|nr:hypothetical protein LSH36_90g01011 [Paralvinella palmiformis]